MKLVTIGRVLPGAKETLATLAADHRVHQAVLSNNLRDISRIKLEVFGLDPYLDLASSPYGDDHTERSKLVAIAQQRATKRMTTRFDIISTPSLSGTRRRRRGGAHDRRTSHRGGK
jgi:phosphoglycolate phosphatase